MSSSSDTACHPAAAQDTLPEQADKQPDLRKSKYQIYGTATKPFGESYRRSLLLLQDPGEKERGEQEQAREREDSPLDTDSVEDTMGCNTSRTEVAVNEETVKGSFIKGEVRPATPYLDPSFIKMKSGNKDPSIVGEVEKKTLNNNEYNKETPERLNDFEIVYGISNKNNSNGYSTTDIYSEVKKPDKGDKKALQTDQDDKKSAREQLMQQIRERKEDGDNAKENAYSTVAIVEKVNGEENKTRKKSEKDEENTAISGKRKDDKITNTVVTSNPVSFVEEEYSYEPDKKEATSKLVVRSRSLVNLDTNQFNYNSTISCTLKRPNKLKITTKPDGTIRYGVRHGSESDILGDDSDEAPSQESEIKNNYVNSIKNAFDAAIESRNQNKTGKAEAFDGLRQYFHDNKRGLQELLINNNVVIIEPFRHESPRSPTDKSDSGAQRTCRITGATIKSPVNEQNRMLTSSNTLPRRHVKSLQNTRQGFYHPIKVNKELIDAELPDPDKVKTARELFERVFKSTSTSDIPSKKQPFHKSFFNTITSKMRITPEVKVIKEGQQTTNDKRRHGRFVVDQVMREDVRKYPLQRRWTDSGSLSSGVSSDFSCDQDCEYHHHHHDGSNSGSNQEILEEYSSDDEEYIYPYDDYERHPVSSEVLQKIRACGTTVTYYGGKVISRSHGQFRSPMTMTIMDEIRQSGGISEGKKRFESDEEPYLGVKFRLVKSNSCGSRLEIAGTEEECNAKLISPRHEDFRGKSIAEEVTDVKEEDTTKEETEEDSQILSTEEEEDKAEADRYVTNVDVTSSKNPQVMTWAELKLKEARKQWHCAPEAVRPPPQDMEFETFEVLDESKPLKVEKNETGRG